jgi:hypothetical protein
VADAALDRVRLGIVRGISYGLFGKPDRFLPQLRELGAGLVRVYFYWSQVEPEPDRWSFDAVDTFLDQLDGSEEVWVTVCSSSRWATRQATDFLPPSPAKDLEAYHRFVDRLVRHCAGRVRNWQCDNEPSNVGRLWAGTAAEYVAQLKVMYQAVKDADPDALVVLGGAPFGLPESPPDSPDRQFFDVLLTDGRDAFDLFDLHLYGEASRIPADIETARGLMRAVGDEKPLVAGEYNGPMAEPVSGGRRGHAGRHGQPVRADAQPAAAAADVHARLPAGAGGQAPPDQLPRGRHAQPARPGLRGAQDHLLEPGPRDPGIREPPVGHGPPVREAGPARLRGHRAVAPPPRRRHLRPVVAGRLTDVDSVVRIEVPGRPSLYLFEVRRRGLGPLLGVWDQRDSFSGEDDPPVAFDWPWPEARAAAVDAFGQPQPAEVRDGGVHLEASVTPLLITAG